MGQDEDPSLSLLRGMAAFVRGVLWEVSFDGMRQLIGAGQLSFCEDQHVWAGLLDVKANGSPCGPETSTVEGGHLNRV